MDMLYTLQVFLWDKVIGDGWIPLTNGLQGRPLMITLMMSLNKMWNKRSIRFSFFQYPHNTSVLSKYDMKYD